VILLNESTNKFQGTRKINLVRSGEQINFLMSTRSADLDALMQGLGDVEHHEYLGQWFEEVCEYTRGRVKTVRQHSRDDLDILAFEMSVQTESKHNSTRDIFDSVVRESSDPESLFRHSALGKLVQHESLGMLIFEFFEII
jgi:hypothetical protein